MKSTYYYLLFSLLFCVSAFNQIKADTGADIVGMTYDSTEVIDIISIEDIANEVLQVITNDTTVVITLPGTFNPNSAESLFSWWMFLYALITPLFLWLFHKFWPSSTKKELIKKSTTAGIIILMGVIWYIGNKDGFNIMLLGQAVIAFIMKILTYDKVLAPFGLKSPRKKSYG